MYSKTLPVPDTPEVMSSFALLTTRSDHLKPRPMSSASIGRRCTEAMMPGMNRSRPKISARMSLLGAREVIGVVQVVAEKITMLH